MAALPATLAEQILQDWRTGAETVELQQLTNIPRERAVELAAQLISALPLGPLGAEEARRMRRLMATLSVLRVVPRPSQARALRARYESAEKLPSSIERLLDQISPLSSDRPITRGGRPASPGVLGFDEMDDPVEGARTPPGSGVDVIPARPPLPMATGNDQVTAGAEEVTEAEQRHIRAEVENHDESQPLRVAVRYSLAFSVGAQTTLSTAFPNSLFAAIDRDVLDLTVQLNSNDFEILSDVSRPLRVPRTGPSRGKARFDVSPLRNGRCRLSASVHYEGNFLTQMQLSFPVGDATGGIQIETTGRPIDGAVALEPRDISLIIRPSGQGYSCIALGSVGNSAELPITVDDLAVAAEGARSALLDVVKMVHGGFFVFQTKLDITPEAERNALRILARAGARLFQRVFLSPGAGADARAVGQWLKDYATDPTLRLTVKVLAERVPIPWAMLYVGDVSRDAGLDWNLFLGMRHIVEQIPFQKLAGTTSNRIESQPTLSVSLNINPTIDAAMQIDLVEKHRQHCMAIPLQRRGLSMFPRSTRTEVLEALADAANTDKFIYFYCHATSSGPDADPDKAALIMGDIRDPSDFATLGDLSLDAPASTEMTGRPLIFLNACDSANLSPRFYDGFVPYFLSKGARGVVGTEAQTPVLFAIHWAEAFLDRLLDGAPIGQAVLDLRQRFLNEHRNPLGLLYAIYCDADTRIAPPLGGAVATSAGSEDGTADA